MQILYSSELQHRVDLYILYSFLDEHELFFQDFAKINYALINILNILSNSTFISMT